MTVLFGTQHGAQRVERTTILTRACLNKFVTSIHYMSLVVTGHNVVLFVLRVVL